MAMCAALDSEQLKYKTMVYSDIDTGVRCSELTGLIWTDFDLDNNEVEINRQRQYIPKRGIIVSNYTNESQKRQKIG